MALNSQLYLQHLNGDESRKDNTRYLIIEDGTARYMKNMQEKKQSQYFLMDDFMLLHKVSYHFPIPNCPRYSSTNTFGVL